MATPSLDKLVLIQKLLSLATHPATDDNTALNAMRRIPVVLSGQGLKIDNLTLASSNLIAAIAASPVARNMEEVDRLKTVIKQRERTLDGLRTRRRRLVRRGASMRATIQSLNLEIRNLRAAPRPVALVEATDQDDASEIILISSASKDPQLASDIAIADRAAMLAADEDKVYPFELFHSLACEAFGYSLYRKSYQACTDGCTDKTVQKWARTSEVPAHAFASPFFNSKHFYTFAEFREKIIEIHGQSRGWKNRYHDAVCDDDSDKNLMAWYRIDRVPAAAFDALPELDWHATPLDEAPTADAGEDGSEAVESGEEANVAEIVSEAIAPEPPVQRFCGGTVPYPKFRSEAERLSGHRLDWRAAFCKATGYSSYEMRKWNRAVPIEVYEAMKSVQWKSIPVLEISYDEFNSYMTMVYGSYYGESRRTFISDADDRYTIADFYTWAKTNRVPISVMEIFDRLTRRDAA